MTAGNNDLDQLAANLSGRLIRPEDMEYDEARRVWNGMIDRRPRAIVCCANEADVTATVQFAAKREILVSVRGGGHNIAGNAVCDEGLVIDLSRLKSILVDPTNRRVRAGGGVLWGEFDAQTQKFGLATTGGLVTTTGIGGFTLGGGLGYLMRSYGLACDNLTSVEMVTAQGDRLVASPVENADLFWALRGGGGNFGVVTTFEYRLYPVGPLLLAGTIAFPLAQARAFLRLYRDWMKTVPDQMSAYASLTTGPDGLKRVGVRVAYNGPVEDASKVIEPLRHFGSPLLDEIQPRTYLEIQHLIDAGFPPGRLNYWKSNFLNELSDELIDIVVDTFQQAPSRFSIIAFEPMGGAVARIAETDSAFRYRNAAFTLLLLGGWQDPADNQANIAWVRDLWEQTRPLSSPGVYVNYLGSEGIDRIRDAYGVNYDRLAAVKQKFDPQNFFRINQNIHPTIIA